MATPPRRHQQLGTVVRAFAGEGDGELPLVLGQTVVVKVDAAAQKFISGHILDQPERNGVFPRESVEIGGGTPGTQQVHRGS
jgi:hypothetical protein